MAILLVVRSWKHEKYTLENCAETVERVRIPAAAILVLSFTIPGSSARIFCGRGAVMAKALGTTPEEEHKLGLHKVAQVCLTLSLISTSFSDNNRSK